MSSKLLVSSILAACLAIGCAAETTSSTNATGESLESRPIPEVAADHDGLLTLLAALEAADLVETLASDGPFTLFAPTDEAFAKIPKEDIDALLADPDALRDLLLYHVIADDLTAADVLAATSLTTAQGGKITVQAEAVTLNGTVNIIETDIIAENGVIHLIDTVLMPLADDGMDDSDIVDIAVSDDRFGTLVTALGVAELVETLQGEGPFTVFAPTDEAFAKLPEGTLDALLHDPDALRDILLYHGDAAGGGAVHGLCADRRSVREAARGYARRALARPGCAPRHPALPRGPGGPPRGRCVGFDLTDHRAGR